MKEDSTVDTNKLELLKSQGNSNPTWEEYKKTNKKRLDRDEADIELHRLEKWVTLLAFRIRNHKRGVQNAIDGIKRDVIEVEKLYRDGRYKE